MKGLTVIVPVYTEAANIQAAVRGALDVLQRAELPAYEIIIVDCKRPDGTDDGTPRLADELARENSAIRVIHNPYVNLGYKYFQGVQAARYDHITWIPGDNENAMDSILETFRHIGEADIIIPYPINPEIRPWSRRFLSRLYIVAYNIAFGLRLRYYNGLSIYRTDQLRRLPQWTESFAFASEILVFLLKSGAPFVEVPIRLQTRSSGKTTAFKAKNIIQVLGVFASMIGRIHFRRERISLK